jgi:hypothetical protein
MPTQKWRNPMTPTCAQLEYLLVESPRIWKTQNRYLTKVIQIWQQAAIQPLLVLLDQMGAVLWQRQPRHQACK